MAFGAGVSLAADYQDAKRNVCEGTFTAGSCAWGSHVTGSENVALGDAMMPALTSGNENVALDFDALNHNTTGSGNIAIGLEALRENNEGGNNIALGFLALGFNTTGGDNVASGIETLVSNTKGERNVADGAFALKSNTEGSFNVASGEGALLNNTGSSNVALGASAGENLTTGSHNIDIANKGIAGESSTTRIGTEGTQTKAFVAGVFPTPIEGCTVQVNNEGQLGCNSKAGAEGKEGKQGPAGAEGKVGKEGTEGKTGATGQAGNAAIATFASNQNVASGQCLNYNTEDEAGGSCPSKATSFPISGLLTAPIPANGATVTNLYAETNATVSGKDTVFVEAINNTNGVALLSCTVNSTSKNHCSNTGSSVAVATGDKIEVRVTASGSSGNNKQWQVTFRY